MRLLYSCHRNPPIPGVPVSISLATITSHAIPRLNRYPVNMWGSVAGARTFENVCSFDSRKTFATFQYSCGIAFTPDIVLITVGHIEHTAIVNKAAGSDFRNTIKPSGNQASGEIGRRTWITGSNIRLNVLESPNRKPSGVPMRMP